MLGVPSLTRNQNRCLARSVLGWVRCGIVRVSQINTTIESQSEYGQRQSSASGSVVMNTVMGAEQLQHIIDHTPHIRCLNQGVRMTDSRGSTAPSIQPTRMGIGESFYQPHISFRQCLQYTVLHQWSQPHSIHTLRVIPSFFVIRSPLPVSRRGRQPY
jgi:hypothetical protein